MKPNIEYHLNELDIARNPESKSHVMPEILQSDRAILDIGCGIGQTLVASVADNERLLIGLDIDLEPLKFGSQRFDHITYINGSAENLAFKDETFDLVMSRVSLPYTNIPRALKEISRVLKKDGRVWFTFHPISMSLSELLDSLRKFHLKAATYRLYVVANGLSFHLTGKQFPFPLTGGYESFQTRSAMERCLKEAGFRELSIEDGKHFICTGLK